MPYSRFMPTVNMTAREAEILNTALEILKRELNPGRVVLFGSRAEGRHRPASDFDLAVDVPRPAEGLGYRIRDKVNDASGLYSVDIVYLPNIDADFRTLILNTGKVVYERETSSGSPKVL